MLNFSQHVSLLFLPVFCSGSPERYQRTLIAQAAVVHALTAINNKPKPI
jgi:hypothetical protein